MMTPILSLEVVGKLLAGEGWGEEGRLLGMTRPVSGLLQIAMQGPLT